MVLADSSPLTAVAYAALGDPEKVLALYARIEPWLQGIACFLLTNTEDIPYVYDPNDPVRQESPDQRIAVHNHIRDYIKLSGRPLQHISGTVEERVRQIDAVIARHRE
ncbi:MAG: AAA family ATPase [Candidatus Roizmanbacteria bacterium]